jgi:hypothetical protein
MTARGGFPVWLVLVLLLSGCATLHREPPRPGRTTFATPAVTLPAELVDNYLILTVKWDKFGPYHFIIDTGSNVTLITPELARRYPVPDAILPEMPQVPVKSADEQVAVLPPTMLSRLSLGGANFTNVPALIYDCAPFTSQLGVKIDGVLGFPLFRQTLLTLDYPHNLVRLQPARTAPAPPGSAIPFDNSDKIPFIPVRLGEDTLIARIDSGSDEGLSLNPVGLDPKYAFGPAAGPVVSTLTGDHTERVGRLADTLFIDDYAVPHPVVEIIDEFSALGGGILKYFTVSFDQEHDRVIFEREAIDPIAVPARRGTGLSFSKTPAYWRVAGVIPGSPAAAAGIEPGDLVTAVNGEAVAQWPMRRYERMVANAERVDLTFLNGTLKTDKALQVVELVP